MSPNRRKNRTTTPIKSTASNIAIMPLTVKPDPNSSQAAISAPKRNASAKAVIEVEVNKGGKSKGHAAVIFAAAQRRPKFFQPEGAHSSDVGRQHPPEWRTAVRDSIGKFIDAEKDIFESATQYRPASNLPFELRSPGGGPTRVGAAFPQPQNLHTKKNCFEGGVVLSSPQPRNARSRAIPYVRLSTAAYIP